MFDRHPQFKKKIKRGPSLAFLLVKKLHEFRNDYHTVEDYYPSHLRPSFDALPIEEQLADRIRCVGKIKAIRVAKAFNQLARLFVSQENDEVFDQEKLDDISINLALLHISEHGDPLALAHGFIATLFQEKMVASLCCHQIFVKPKCAPHPLIVIFSEKEGNRLVLDPYFNFCGSFREYWNDDRISAYFQAESNDPTWTYEKVAHHTQIQHYTVSNTPVNLYFKQVDDLIELLKGKHTESLRELTPVFAEVKALNEHTLSKKGAREFLSRHHKKNKDPLSSKKPEKKDKDDVEKKMRSCSL